MRPLTCAATRRRLNAFHDRELAVADEIAVASHLEWCDCCGSVSAEMRAIGAALRAAMPGRVTLSNDEDAAFGATLISRLKAERDASFPARLTEMFDDMRLVYAGLAGAVAFLACVLVLLTTMQFAIDEQPDTLAITTASLAMPGATSPVAIDGEVRSRWTARVRQANETALEDAVFDLSAALSRLVTREGRIPSLQYLRNGRRGSVEHARVIEGLLDALSRARFEQRLAHHEHDRARDEGPGDRSTAASAQEARGYLFAGGSTCAVVTFSIESLARSVRPRMPSSPSIATS